MSGVVESIANKDRQYAAGGTVTKGFDNDGLSRSALHRIDRVRHHDQAVGVGKRGITGDQRQPFVAELAQQGRDLAAAVLGCKHVRQDDGRSLSI